jgi:hypothetical protein
MLVQQPTQARKSQEMMVENILPAHLAKRIEELHGREHTYIEDELFSEEALTNLLYREELERAFKLNSLGSLPS